MVKVWDVHIADKLASPVLVFDVGGSHVSAAVCLDNEFQLGHVFKGEHPSAQTSEAFVALLYALGVEAAASLPPVTGATLAMPCPFDFETGICLMRHKLPYLYGVNLRNALAGRFGWEPAQVQFLNDADAYLMGEVGAGAARGFARVVAITLGTGTGSAFALEGRLLTDGPGVPLGGEIWDLPYEGGIVEDFLSSRAILGGYQRRTGKASTVAALAETALTDPAARETFTEFGKHLGRVLNAKLAGFSPDVVVIGGGISRAAHLFLPAALQQLNGPPPELRVSELQDLAPLVGCGVARYLSRNGSAPSIGASPAHSNQA
jgi:glucokinase